MTDPELTAHPEPDDRPAARSSTTSSPTRRRPDAISLRAVNVRGRRDMMLDDVTLRLEAGSRLLVVGEPGHGHTALALVATGRLVPDTGDVLVNGMPDPGRLRGSTAVVDVPGVSEPDEALTVAGTAAEMLALAGHRATPRAVTRWITQNGFAEVASWRVDQVEPLVRTTLLTALAAEDPRVRFLVLTLPDRHGGSPHEWWSLAAEYAARGHGVLVECTPASAHVLHAAGLVGDAEEVVL